MPTKSSQEETKRKRIYRRTAQRRTDQSESAATGRRGTEERLVGVDSVQTRGNVLFRLNWSHRRVERNTPSGKEYLFHPGESKEVNPEDADYFRDLAVKRGGCCGTPVYYQHPYEEIPKG